MIFSTRYTTFAYVIRIFASFAVKILPQRTMGIHKEMQILSNPLTHFVRHSMTKHFSIIFIAALVIAIPSTLVVAQAPARNTPTMVQSRETTAQRESDTISVVVDGYGKDIDSALQNALRAAVQQAVGTLVSAETLVENDDVVKDKILSFSGGFIKTHRQLGEPKTENGITSVRIAAEVKRNDLNEKLQSAGVVKIAVNPDRLRFEIQKAKINEQSRNDGIEMLQDILEEFPLNVYDISGDFRYDEGTRKIVVDVEIKVNAKKYATFEKEFTDLTAKLGGKRLGTKTMKVIRNQIGHGENTYAYTSVDKLYNSRVEGRQQEKIFCFVASDGWPNFRRAGQDASVTFTDYDVTGEVWGKIRPLFDQKGRKMVIQAVDSKGSVIATGKIIPPMPSTQFSDFYGGDVNIIFPWLHLSANGPNPRETGSFGRNSWPGTPEYTLPVVLDLSPDAKITAVHISME